MKLKLTPFKFKPFSRKQKQLLTWWTDNSPVKDYDAIIADGAIRAGKTLPMSLSFVIWAMNTFNYQNFGMAGKTISALRRNVINLLKVMLLLRGYWVKEHRGDDNYLIVSRGNVVNYFYLFGGHNERSQDLIQGITLAGMYFDEVALMPESFVNQAVGRCSVDGSKLWFNCNPAGPYHWFKVEWIEKLKEKNALHLHFTMDDNLSLSERIKERYRRMFSGVFYLRYILGLWVMAEGVIYDMWDDQANTFNDETAPQGLEYAAMRYIAIDYGTSNPMVFLDIWDDGTTAWQVNEYYYNSKVQGAQKTDSQYADDLEAFIGSEIPVEIILDPSAASFKAELRQRGYRVKDADNDVLDGIRTTASAIGLRIYRVHERCVNTRKEITSYVWDEKAGEKGDEKPVKANDHAMDAMRYFCKTKIKAWRLAA